MNRIGRPLSSPPDAAECPDVGEFAARLLASPSYRALCAEERPDVSLAECVRCDLDSVMGDVRRPTPYALGEACDALCRAYERDDRSQVRTTAEFIAQDVQPILDRYVGKAA